MSCIEDYVLFGDGCSVVLVSCEGLIDWLCWLCFDSDICFVVLLGNDDYGCWQFVFDIWDGFVVQMSWCYCFGIVMLEMYWEIDIGMVWVDEVMFWYVGCSCFVCSVWCLIGMVCLCFVLCVCFDYGWVWLGVCWCGDCWQLIMGLIVFWFDGVVDVVFDDDGDDLCVVLEFIVGVQ